MSGIQTRILLILAPLPAPLAVVRAFVFGISPRAVLAIAALALSTAYAIVSGAALAGLEGGGASLAQAQEDRGWLLTTEDGSRFARTLAPAQSTFVLQAEHQGLRIATIEPWPGEAGSVYRGAYAEPPPDWLDDLDAVVEPLRFAPADALTVPPEHFHGLVVGARSSADAAYVAGAAPPAANGLVLTQWQGLATFYEVGAEQIRSGLVFVILAAGAIASLLAAGFAHLEVMARRSDLATLETLAGPSHVRGLVIARVVVLVLAGIILGTVAAVALVRLAASAAGQDAFAVSWLAAAGTWAVAGLGGLVFGTAAALGALRAPLRERMGRPGMPRRFRGPVRFLVVTPRLFAGVFAATLVGGAVLGVLVQTSAVPSEMFGGTADESVVVNAAGNPLRGQTDRFVAENARFLDDVRAAMPETYAPTAYRDRPVLVRGTDFAAWQEYANPTLTEGHWPEAPGEATVGQRLARLQGLGPGDELVLPTSYAPGHVRLDIVGVHRTNDFADDEIWTGLDAAGQLAGLPADKVTLFRVKLANPDLPWSEVQPSDGIEVVDIAVDPPQPPPLSSAVVLVTGVNFADREQSRVIQVRIDGAVVAEARLQLDAHERTTLRVPVTTPASGVFELEVNPTRQVQTAEQTLVVSGPAVARPGDLFQIRVYDASGAPAAGARLFRDGALAATTYNDGIATLSVAQEGMARFSVRHGGAGDEDHGAITLRVAPREWDDQAVLRVETLFLDDPQLRANDTFRVRAEATIVNLGGVAANETIFWTVDAANVTNVTIGLAPGERTTVAASLMVEGGDRVIGIADGQQTIRATTEPDPSQAGAEAPRTIEELLARKRAQALRQTEVPADASDAFLENVFASLEAASVLVVLATVAHSGALVWVAVVREARERVQIVALLEDLGAQRHQLENRALRDTALAVLVPMVLAGVTTLALFALGRYFAFPAAFGHALPTAGTAGVVFRTALGLLVIAWAAAFYAVRSSTRSRRSAATPADLELAELLEQTRGPATR